jgi:hypothetical protein
MLSGQIHLLINVQKNIMKFIKTGKYLLLTFFILIACFWWGTLFCCMFGPYLMFLIGEGMTKVVSFSIIPIVGITYWVLFRIDKRKNKINVQLTTKDKNSKIALFMGILAFCMSPFGFAGQLHWKGDNMPPVLSGSLCLIFGIFLIWPYLENRKQVQPYTKR